MLSFTRRGIIIGILVALSGGIILPAAAQDGAQIALTGKEQTVTELRELAKRFPGNEEMAAFVAQAERGL